MHERVQATVRNNTIFFTASTGFDCNTEGLFRFIYEKKFELPCILILTEEGLFFVRVCEIIMYMHDI